MAELKEVAVNYVVGDDTITYYAAEQKRINRIMRQKKQYPDDVQIVAINDDGSILVTLPLSWFKPPSPPKKVSEENKKAAGERMKKWHDTKV